MISTRNHGIIDYTLATALIALPWVFAASEAGPEAMLPVGIGVMILLQSLLTNYEMGLVGFIPMRVHLGVDVLAGCFLASSPWLFGFVGRIWLPHMLIGLVMVGSGLATSRFPARPPLSGQGVPASKPRL